MPEKITHISGHSMKSNPKATYSSNGGETKFEHEKTTTLYTNPNLKITNRNGKKL